MHELQTWFLENKRDFPWRQDPTPYKVWISEIMLQQTRAVAVIAYFEKWMRLFPNIQALANAAPEEVIKAWEGLGYYARARNLHKAAKEIVERFHGKLPGTREELESLSGIGPYTLGAILSFGFHEKAAAVDGNVIRVITRYFRIEEDVGRAAVKRQIEEKTYGLLGDKKPWVTMEALIELGATVCTPSPRCEMCPLQKTCQGKEKTLYLPIKKKGAETIVLQRRVFVIEAEGQVLVKEVEAGKVMAGLHEFPWCEKKEKLSIDLAVEILGRLSSTSHTFTKYKADLYPVRAKSHVKPVEGYRWIKKEELPRLAFSAGHRRIRDEYLAS